MLTGVGDAVSGLPTAAAVAEAEDGSMGPGQRLDLLLVALVISLLLHFAGLYGWSRQQPVAQWQPLTSSPLSLQLMNFAPPVPTPAFTEARPAATKAKSEAAPVARPEPRPRATPKPRSATQPRDTRPARQVPTKPAVEHATATTRHDDAQQQARSPASVLAEPTTSTPPAPPTTNLSAVRSDYLQALIGHIESFKFYPTAARRRGIEASVQVRFVLMADGSIQGLQIQDGHKLLRQAAQETLRRAEPLPAAPASIEYPLQVEYRMAFALQ